MKDTPRSIIVITILAVIVGSAYILLTSQGSSSNTDTEQLEVATQSDRIISNINSVNELTLNTSILTDPRFTSLTDVTTPLPVVSSGRPNPFEPVP